jgi:RecQ family ATP-dependent DNA helicase
MPNLGPVLRVLGKEVLRDGQLQPVLAALRGESVLVVRPTGSGKSLCFQLPTLLTPGTAFILSPLKALMSQQASELHGLKIPATFLNGDLGPDEKSLRYELLERHFLKFFFCTPERFDAQMVRPDEVERVTSFRPNFLVVDEAHCVDRWGKDFRPNYGRLGQVRRRLGDPPVLAFTATAGPAARAAILQSIGVPEAQAFLADVDRPNIALCRLPVGRLDDRRVEIVADLLTALTAGRAMIFVPTLKSGEGLQARLARRGVDVGFYHGRLKPNDRANLLGRFQGTLEPAVNAIICTNAFGMGLDIPDVRVVIHWAHASSVEDHLQEFGRAGRDGRPSLAVLFVDRPADTNLLEFMAKKTMETAATTSRLSEEEVAAGLNRKTAAIHQIANLADPQWRRPPRGRKGRRNSACFRQELLDALTGDDPEPQKTWAIRLLERVFAVPMRRRPGRYCCDECDSELIDLVPEARLDKVLGLRRLPPVTRTTKRGRAWAQDLSRMPMAAAVLLALVVFGAFVLTGGFAGLPEWYRVWGRWLLGGAMALIFVSLRIEAPALIPVQAQVVIPVDVEPTPPSCPLCGSRMAMRTARNDPTNKFWGCTRYPDCRGLANLGRR